VQEQCLVARFNGGGAQEIARQLSPSRQTVMRWMHWVLDRFKDFRPDLQSRFPVLGYESGPLGWWKKLIQTIRLSLAMAILNTMGVNVP
jgi:hypothetical protein